MVMKNIKTFEDFTFIPFSERINFFAMIKINKEWEIIINDALKIVPKDAIPTIICNFSQFPNITGRKDIINTKTRNNYGVTIQSYDIKVPKEFITDEIIEIMKKKNFYNSHVLELSETFTLFDSILDKSIQIVGYNCSKYKKLIDITERKEDIDKKYKEKTGKEYFFNKTGKLTIYHELGHVFMNRVGKSIPDSPEWKYICSKWYLECKKDIIKIPSEAFPEAFADYFANNGENLPEYIKEFIKEKTQ
jgi:hypothetical protein